MMLIDTGDGGVTLAESGFVLRWHLGSRSYVSFGPLNSALQSGLDVWDVEAVFSASDLFDVWLGRSQGFDCEKVLFRLTSQGFAFRHVDGVYSGGFQALVWMSFVRSLMNGTWTPCPSLTVKLFLLDLNFRDPVTIPMGKRSVCVVF